MDRRRLYASFRSFKNDIRIRLSNRLFQKGTTFNVSKFCRKYYALPEATRKQLDTFTSLLYDKVRVDRYDSRYRIIYQELEILVRRICEKLSCVDECFKNYKLHKTGSAYSGTKVGLPHEADFILELQLCDGVLNQSLKYKLYKLVKQVLTEHKQFLINEFGLWQVNFIKQHRRGIGICIALEFKAKDSEEVVGVSVDLVLAHSLSRLRSKRRFTKKAKTYLSKTLKQFLHEGKILKLFGKSEELDTGLIENNILNSLPDDTKHGYSVAKYLLQYIVSSEEPCFGISIISDSMPELYGYRPKLKSYWLRALFLHLLIHTHGTAEAEKLTGGALVLCLLDILRYLPGYPYQKLAHPLLKNEQIFIGGSVPWHFPVLIDNYAINGHFSDIEYYRLLNSDEPNILRDIVCRQCKQVFTHNIDTLIARTPSRHNPAEADIDDIESSTVDGSIAPLDTDDEKNDTSDHEIDVILTRDIDDEDYTTHDPKSDFVSVHGVKCYASIQSTSCGPKAIRPDFKEFCNIFWLFILVVFINNLLPPFAFYS